MTLIAQISDLHLRPPGQLVEGRIDTPALLQACIKRINQLPERPQLVVASGDLADTGDLAEYMLLKNLLDELSMPYVVMCGNHDRRAGLRAVFGGTAALPVGGNGYLQYVLELPGLNLLCLDTLDEGKEAGWLCMDRLNWLHDALGTHRTSIFIFLHHPPFDCGIAGMDAIKLSNPQALAEVLKPHAHVVGLSCGHVHRAVFTSWVGIPACICPSPAHQIHLDTRPDVGLSWTLEPGGFLLHRWNGVSMVSHAVFGPTARATAYC